MTPRLYRVRLPAVPGRELRAGFDRRLHRGGQQALPLRIQPHHQRQAGQWEHTRTDTQARTHTDAGTHVHTVP